MGATTDGCRGIEELAGALTKQTRKAKRNQQKLQKEFLEQRVRESVSAMAPEEQRKTIETIV